MPDRVFGFKKSKSVVEVVAHQNNLTTEDLDTVQITGIYMQNYTSNATSDRHYPVKASGCLMCISTSEKAYQYYVCQNEGCIWMRRYNSKTWSDWDQIYPSVASGSNDNGFWIKYPDGTMICYGVERFDDEPVQDGDYLTGTKALHLYAHFPTSFVDTEYIVNAALDMDGGYTAYLGRTGGRQVDFTGMAFIVTDKTQESFSGSLRWQAIGRWK